MSEQAHEVPMPWAKRSPQQEGLQTEKRLAKSYGMRVHPRSGAGRIKHDASNEDTILESKEANSTHTLSGDYLNTFYVRAMQQGKEPLYVVRFKQTGIIAEIKLSKSVV